MQPLRDEKIRTGLCSRCTIKKHYTRGGFDDVYRVIGLFSGNYFDGSVEASMTAAFVFGPVGAIVGVIAGAILGRPKLASANVPN